MKKTSLYEKHIENNAKMVPFAGFIMPVQYEGVNVEHLCVRNGVGIFDVSHMGEFFINGKNSLQMLNYLCTNNIEKLDIGKAQYNCMTNERGGIIDDLIIYKIDNNEYMLVVNASNIDKDWKWINHHNKKFKNKISNKSDETSLIAVQGPKSFNLLNEITGINTNTLNNYSFIRTSIAGCKDVILSTTGYTGSGGFEIYCKNDDAIKIWNKLFSLKNKFSLKPAGLASRDTLRIEMGYCLYGNEIDENISPIQAGLSWITKTETNFYGSDRIKEDIENGCKYTIVGVKSEERMIPRNGDIIFNSDKTEIGKITSGTFSPTLKTPIGIGFILKEDLNYDEQIFINNKRKKFKAKISSLPFTRI